MSSRLHTMDFSCCEFWTLPVLSSLLFMKATGIVLPEDASRFSPRCWVLDQAHEGDDVTAHDVMYADLYNVTVATQDFEFPASAQAQNMSFLCFAGSHSSYASIAHAGQLPAGGDFAWVMVLRPEGASDGVILEYEADSMESHFLSIRQSDDNFKIFAQTPEASYKASFVVFSPVTSWKMLIISYRASTEKLSIFYGDFPKGKLTLKTLDKDIPSFNATGTIRLGSSKDLAIAPFTGCIGCLAYFHWAVTSVNTTVQELCNPWGDYSKVWSEHSERTRRVLTPCPSCTTTGHLTPEVTTHSGTTSLDSSSTRFYPLSTTGEADTESITTIENATKAETSATESDTSTGWLETQSSYSNVMAVFQLATTTTAKPLTSSRSLSANITTAATNGTSTAAVTTTPATSGPTQQTTSTVSTGSPSIITQTKEQQTTSTVSTGSPSIITQTKEQQTTHLYSDQSQPITTRNTGAVLCTCRSVHVQQTENSAAAVLLGLTEFSSMEFSAKRRKKECASDHRRSAMTLGLSGVLVIVFVVSIIVLPDVHRAIVYMCAVLSIN